MDSRTDRLSEVGVTKVLKTDKLKKVEKNLKHYFYLFIKRTFDLIVSVIGLIPLAILSIIVKIAYVINGDFSPIFFVQKRIGKKGKEFNFYKFRSMVPNADEILFEMLEKNPDIKKEYEINKKLKNDPRITKMGNILRKTSLDELPQILKVNCI